MTSKREESVRTSTPAATEAIVFRFSPQSTHSEHLRLSRKPDIFLKNRRKRDIGFPEEIHHPPRAGVQPRARRVRTAACHLKTPQPEGRLRAPAHRHPPGHGRAALPAPPASHTRLATSGGAATTRERNKAPAERPTPSVRSRPVCPSRPRSPEGGNGSSPPSHRRQPNRAHCACAALS